MAMRVLILLSLVLHFTTAGAVTIHRSFVSREVGSGAAGAIIPVDKRVADAVDKARETKRITGKVTKVSDGDTIWVTPAGGMKVKVRLDRIDAPESDQPYGKESAKALKDLIFGKEVRIEYAKTDQYGRILGIVYLGAEDINLKMVREGHAWHYAYFDKTPAYNEAEKTAKNQKSGLWAGMNPINPYQWRKSHK